MPMIILDPAPSGAMAKDRQRTRDAKGWACPVRTPCGPGQSPMGPEPTTPRYPRALVVTVATVQGHDFITCPQGAPRSEESPMEPTANRGLARARHVLVEELEKVVLRIARRQCKQEDLAPPTWLDAEIETLGGVQAIELANASHADFTRLTRRRQPLEAALERVQAGTWGGCKDCGEWIAPARLAALPHARNMPGMPSSARASRRPRDARPCLTLRV